MYSQYPIYSSSTQVHVVEETAVNNDSSQLCISGDVELNPVQLGSVQSSTLLENTVNCTLWFTYGSPKLVDLTCWVQLHGDDNTGKVQQMIRTADCHMFLQSAL